MKSEKVAGFVGIRTAAAVRKAFRDSARAIVLRDRAADGAFGGDWCGPVNGVWRNAGFNEDQLEISAQAVMMAVVGDLFPSE